MFKGGPGSPPIFDPGWLLSDRPPLQIGYVLMQRVFGWDERMTHYEVIGVVLQQFWVIGMWGVLIAARVTRRTRSLAMVAALVSARPHERLLRLAEAAGRRVRSRCLGARRRSGSFVAPQPSVDGRAAWSLAGLAYLSRGTSVFGLIPLAAIALWKGLPSWRWLAAGAAALCVLVLPWIAFQHYEDPPGDRLLKWQLAGNGTQDDPRGTVEMLLDEYGKAGVGGALENKLQNFLTMAGGNAIERPPKKGDPFGDWGRSTPMPSTRPRKAISPKRLRRYGRSGTGICSGPSAS